MLTKLVTFIAAIFIALPVYAQGTPKTKSAIDAEINAVFPDNVTGAITPAAVRGAFHDFNASWQQYTGVNAQAGTSYTFQASDYGQLVTFNNSGAVAVTLPQAIGLFFPWNVTVSNYGAGTVTITPQGGSTINGGSSLAIATNGSVNIVSNGTNYLTTNDFTTIFASPPPIGNVTPNTGAFTTFSAIPSLSAFYSINSAGSPTTATFASGGNGINPITAITPSVGISRWETISADTEAGQNAALLITSAGQNVSSLGVNAQVNALSVFSKQVSGGLGDNVAGYFNAQQSGGPLGTSRSYGAFGIFTVATADTNAHNIAIGANFVTQNNTGSDCAVASAAPPGGYGCGTYGLALQGAGTNLNTAAFSVYAPSPAQFDAGMYFLAGSIKTTTISDESSSTNVLAVTGTHTTIVDASSATCTDFLKSPSSAFKATCAGVITGVGTNITGLPISTGLTGAGTGVLTALGVNTGTAGAFQVNNASIKLNALAFSTTAPTIASGFCSTASNTTISASNGTAAFDILIGGATCGTTGTLTMPAATTGWVCESTDVTTPASHNVVQTGTQGSTTAVVLTDYSRTTGIAQNFNPADHIHVMCTGY